MSLDDVIDRRGEGALAAAWSIDGIPYLFTSIRAASFNTTGLPSGLTALRGCLQSEGLQWGAGADPKTGDLKIPDNTFRLVDVEDPSGTQHKITDILRGVEGVAKTDLLLTILASEVGSIGVLDTTGFPDSGDLWVDQECIGYTGKTGTTFTTLTRGKYGSKAVEHVSLAGGAVPEVASGPVDWYGRYCTLWVAELHYGAAAGTLITGTPKAVWRGRLLDNYGLSPDGMTWEFPAEGLWEVIDATIPVVQASTSLRGVSFGGSLTIDWAAFDDDLAVVDRGTATLSPGPPYPGYDGWNSFLTAISDSVNVSLAAAGLDDGIQIQKLDGGERIAAYKKAPDEVGDRKGNSINLYFRDNLLALFDVFTIPDTAINLETAVRVGREGLGQATAVVIMPARGQPFTLPVTKSIDFEVFSDATAISDVHAVVRVGDFLFTLLDIPDGQSLRVVDSTTPGSRRARDLNQERILMTSREDPSPVVQGIFLHGDYVECWRRFIEGSASDGIKGYLDTDDFDWDELHANKGGPAYRRRVLLEPASFRDFLRQDLAWSGAYPTISSGSTGKLSARVLGGTNSADVKLFIDGSIIAPGRKVTYQEGRGRIINRLVYRGGYTWADQDFTNDDPLTINDRRGQQAARISPKTREVKNSGIVDWATRDSAGKLTGGAEQIAATAKTYFSLFGRPYPIVKVPCTIAAAHLVPGDTVRLSHWLLPDKAFGVRGVTNQIMLVLENIIHPFDDTSHCDLTLLWITDGAKRSGYAPCADVTAYAAPGGNHTLTLDSGVYATVQAEGLYFKAGEKVVLQQIDVPPSGAVADEAFEVVSMSADGLAMVIDGAPGAGMQTQITAGNVWVIHDLYQENAGNSAQQWLYVCDDADHLIGTTTDLGYLPS